ncbi:hypothetical protein GBAR_LOCUS19495 [Geodia barretti]|uniref:NR LBD domain-containing protein n=1 Tax=Geodia barretti TaxID=519541 RepID=A0AA35STY2_GEOBA|nr:hypothetical protein GBAR_LOCUS19495 [Geodia barretti]
MPRPTEHPYTLLFLPRPQLAPPPLPSTPHVPQYPPHSSLLSLPTFTRHNNLLFSQSPGAVFLNSSQQVPFRVLPVAQPLLPFMASFPSFQPQVQSCTNEIAPGPSPFSIIPIPSSTARLPRPTQVQPQHDEELPQPSLPPPETGDIEEPPPSAPPSTRASPEPSFKTSSTDGDTFPEAEVDEVLDSLRQRIRKMFSWAKSDVTGFEDLSPLDQKALLRRTVAELVMLGFARASIAYDGKYFSHTNH